jgi:hypothetical protein
MLCLLCYCTVFQVMLDVTITPLMQLYLQIQLKHSTGCLDSIGPPKFLLLIDKISCPNSIFAVQMTIQYIQPCNLFHH